VIGKIAPRGHRVAGLLRYLYGPGRANEHVDPHMVAAWDEPASLEPGRNARGQRDFRHLVSLLEQPLAAAGVDGKGSVWHCSLRSAPEDRRLSDEEWAEVAREVVERTGLAPAGDDGGCRWAAVRHAEDHVHLVVTLARQDGHRARGANDYYRVGEACRAVEAKFGLRVTAGRDRTAPKRATRAETEKACRRGRSEAPRRALLREVRVAAAGAASFEEFRGGLAKVGVLVRPRMSQLQAGVITGYAVAWPGDVDGAGKPIWYGGGKLHADLSFTRLNASWSGVEASGSGADPSRSAVWAEARDAAARASAAVRTRGITDPTMAADVAHAAAAQLAAAARSCEGLRGGPLTAASADYERAAAELWAKAPARSQAGTALRLSARALSVLGRAQRSEAAQALALVLQLLALVEAVAELRWAQQRLAQAEAARSAADGLRSHAGQAARVATGTAVLTRPPSGPRRGPGRPPPTTPPLGRPRR
jgi:hypothetical protein